MKHTPPVYNPFVTGHDHQRQEVNSSGLNFVRSREVPLYEHTSRGGNQYPDNRAALYTQAEYSTTCSNSNNRGNLEAAPSTLTYTEDRHTLHKLDNMKTT